GVQAKKWRGSGEPAAARDREEFIRLAGLLQANLQATESGLAVAFENASAPTLAPVVKAPLQAYVAASAALLRALDRDAIHGAAPRAVEAAAEAQLAANLALWQTSLAGLDELLQARIGADQRKKQLVDALALLSLL